MNVHQSLTEFVNRYLDLVPASNRQIPFDPAWPSPCIEETNVATGELVEWTPVPQAPAQHFSNIENALDMSIHVDIKAFYTAFWSDNLPARAKEGGCELLQPWNENDFERLQENLIGHVLMKQRLKQQITFFIGVTDEEDFILTVDNESGQVMLEQVGKEPDKVLAESLSAFIEQLDVI